MSAPDPVGEPMDALLLAYGKAAFEEGVSFCQDAAHARHAATERALKALDAVRTQLGSSAPTREPELWWRCNGCEAVYSGERCSECGERSGLQVDPPVSAPRDARPVCAYCDERHEGNCASDPEGSGTPLDVLDNLEALLLVADADDGTIGTFTVLSYTERLRAALNRSRATCPDCEMPMRCAECAETQRDAATFRATSAPSDAPRALDGTLVSELERMDREVGEADARYEAAYEEFLRRQPVTCDEIDAFLVDAIHDARQEDIGAGIRAITTDSGLAAVLATRFAEEFEVRNRRTSAPVGGVEPTPESLREMAEFFDSPNRCPQSLVVELGDNRWTPGFLLRQIAHVYAERAAPTSETGGTT